MASTPSPSAGPSKPEDCWHTAQKLRKVLQRQVEKSNANSGVDLTYFNTLETTLAEYRLACVAVIFTDFEYAHEIKIENALWQAHSLVHSEFRKAHQFLQSTSFEVEKRKLKQTWLSFLDIAHLFYQGYVKRLATKFVLKDLHEVAGTVKSLGLIEPTKDEACAISPELTQLVRESCYLTLIRLGDLVRYDHQVRPKEGKLDGAMAWYSLAKDLIPDAPQASHQMGIVALVKDLHIEVLFHFYRALAASKPHPIAQQNLEAEFRSIVHRSSDPELTRGTPDTLLVLAKWFIILHGHLYHGDSSAPQRNELLREVTHRLELGIKFCDPSVRFILVEMVVVNFSAHCVAARRLDKTKSAEDMHFRDNTLHLIYQFTVTCCRVIMDELESIDYSFKPLPTDEPEQPVAQDDQEDLVSTRGIVNALPCLRLLCVWLVSCRKEAMTMTEVEGEQEPILADMHRSVAKVGSILMDAVFNTNYSMAACPFLLAEDEIALGMDVLCHEDLPPGCRLGYNEADGSRKTFARNFDKSNFNVARQSLARIYDILKCIYFLAADDNYPLRVFLVDHKDGNQCFAYAYTGDDEAATGAVVGPAQDLAPHPAEIDESADAHLISYQQRPREDFGIGGLQRDRPQTSSQLDDEASAELLRRLDEFIHPPENEIAAVSPARRETAPSLDNDMATNSGTYRALPWEYFINSTPGNIGAPQGEEGMDPRRGRAFPGYLEGSANNNRRLNASSAISSPWNDSFANAGVRKVDATTALAPANRVPASSYKLSDLSQFSHPSSSSVFHGTPPAHREHGQFAAAAVADESITGLEPALDHHQHHDRRRHHRHLSSAGGGDEDAGETSFNQSMSLAHAMASTDSQLLELLNRHVATPTESAPAGLNDTIAPPAAAQHEAGWTPGPMTTVNDDNSVGYRQRAPETPMRQQQQEQLLQLQRQQRQHERLQRQLQRQQREEQLRQFHQQHANAAASSSTPTSDHNAFQSAQHQQHPAQQPTQQQPAPGFGNRAAANGFGGLGGRSPFGHEQPSHHAGPALQGGSSPMVDYAIDDPPLLRGSFETFKGRLKANRIAYDSMILDMARPTPKTPKAEPQQQQRQ